MKDILRARLAENFSWARLGVWIGLVNGGNVAEVEIEYGYQSAVDLRDMANALNEAADLIDKSSTSSDRDLLEAIGYLDAHKTNITMSIDDLPVQIVTSNIKAALLSLAKALREKEGES